MTGEQRKQIEDLPHDTEAIYVSPSTWAAFRDGTELSTGYESFALVAPFGAIKVFAHPMVPDGAIVPWTTRMRKSVELAKRFGLPVRP